VVRHRRRGLRRVDGARYGRRSRRRLARGRVVSHGSEAVGGLYSESRAFRWIGFCFSCLRRGLVGGQKRRA